MKYLFTAFFASLLSISLPAQTIQPVKLKDVLTIIDTTQQPLVINFWASWCLPCIHEIPWFEKNVALYKDKGVKLLLVSLDFADDYPKKLQAFVQKNQYRSQVVWLNETDASAFCPQVDPGWQGNIPATLFLHNARQYRHFLGRQVTEEQLKIELNQLTK